MKPERLAESRLLAAALAILIAVAVVLTVTVGSGREVTQRSEAPSVTTREQLRREAEAAGAACARVTADAGCLLFVLQRTRSLAEMPALAREYGRAGNDR